MHLGSLVALSSVQISESVEQPNVPTLLRENTLMATHGCGLARVTYLSRPFVLAFHFSHCFFGIVRVDKLLKCSSLSAVFLQF